MRILIDMNLSPDWTRVFIENGWQAVHWVDVGSPSAPDRELMEWARNASYVVFTQDLDFGTLLATTGASAPSVVQLRCEDTRPASMSGMVVAALRGQESQLAGGALMTIDPRKMRLTLLPLRSVSK
ncbi:MAG: DUF5615 family PIN-like protein [Verrucomicrobiales bacterium]|nr:DUF5615 family PIN-like protein [Verrucomicrobiales bacterium]